MARKRVSTARIVVLVLIIVALAIAIYFVWQWRTGGPAGQIEKIQRRTDQAEGDTRERVVQLMGEPNAESGIFPLPDEARMAANAAKTDARTWLLWEARGGVKCVVGLDATGHVVYAGHTGR